MVARKLREKSGLTDNKYKIFREVYGISPSDPMTFSWKPKCYNCRPNQCKYPFNNVKEYWSTEYQNDENGKIILKQIVANGVNYPCICTPTGGYTLGPRTYEFATMWPDSYNEQYLRNVNNVIHELGHGFNSRLNFVPSSELASYTLTVDDNPWRLTDKTKGFYKAPKMIYYQSKVEDGSETFADMFIGWTSNVWALDEYGNSRREFMESRMPSWILDVINR